MLCSAALLLRHGQAADIFQECVDMPATKPGKLRLDWFVVQKRTLNLILCGMVLLPIFVAGSYYSYTRRVEIYNYFFPPPIIKPHFNIAHLTNITGNVLVRRFNSNTIETAVKDLAVEPG